MMTRCAALLVLLLSLAVPTVGTARPPSDPGVDAPQLAPLGPYAVGLRRMELVQPAQADLARLDRASGRAPVADRVLPVSLWYPAQLAPAARRVTYSASLPAEKPDQPPVPILAEGVAVQDATPVVGKRFPLVILSHGYSGAPEAVTWLAENLASKGYVVAAISHRDPGYADVKGFAGPLQRRPLDVAFVAHSLITRTRAGEAGLAGMIDPDRVALIGYSMGGYGVLTEAAGGFDRQGAPAKLLPPAYVDPYLPGGARRDDLRIDGLKAVVAISPFTGLAGVPALTPAALGQIRAPLLLIAGDRDAVVGFTGVRAVFDQAVGAPRRLLVFREAGHSIGMNPAVAGDEASLWALDWFEDPVWRKARIIGVSLHMITAFLDLYVKGDQDKAAYLDVAVPRSDDAVWPKAEATAYGQFSNGQAPVTVWKGFQNVHTAGLELWTAAAAPGLDPASGR